MTTNREAHNLFAIPSNKFYPPHIDPSQSLLRTSLLSRKLPSKIKAKKAILVEAQAGQGKTTLVSQFLSHHNFEFIWYQIGPEDTDPFLLLSSLMADVSMKFENFSSPQLTTILQEGQVGPLDLERCTNILLHDINSFLKKDLFIVFDDLHLLTGATLTNKVLEHLIDTSPPKLHFVLSSRQPLEVKSKVLRDPRQISYINTHDLALNEVEIEELYTNIFDQDITKQDAKDIQRITNGWVMGIVLASHPVSGQSRFWNHVSNGSITDISSDQGHMLEYFQDEIFAKIPAELHLPFLQLSFISEISVELAALLTGIDRFEAILSDMTRENFFVYRLDDKQSTFRFHHFFQEFLQIQARRQLSEKEIKAIYLKEAEYYIAKEMVGKALVSYKKAGQYRIMEQIIVAKGMDIVAQNKTLSVLALLDSIPKEVLFKYSWLTFFAGLLRNDFTPQTTLPYYVQAKEQFILNNDETGELLCLSQMIYFHFVISGQYKVGSELLPRTAQLLKKNEKKLSPEVKIFAARNLASGLCFFNGQMDEARKYILMASQLATRINSRNFLGQAIFIQGYIELLSGNRSKFLRDAEACYSMVNDPRVGMSNKLTIRIMFLSYLSMAGDFLNFKKHQEEIQASIDPTIVDQTVAAPYFFVWGAVCHFSMGQTETAMNLLSKGFGITSTASTSHMHSQLLQWQAYGLSLEGNHDQALDLIKESAELRHDAGGLFYETFHDILAGSVLTRAGQFIDAETTLNSALERSRQIPSTFLIICALMQRAYLKLVAYDAETALDDLEDGLALMRNNGFTHFWGWEPTMMARLLSAAVVFDIEKGFAQMLARERLRLNFSDEGQPINLLAFTLLDQFQISIKEDVISRARDLTPSQRELLGLLLTAKGQRISQERIQLELWPDNIPENARKSFDTLLARLRKELSNSSGTQIKKYIFMQKGILCLSNYQMDFLQFSESARQGMMHSKNGDWWQASNAFNHALYHWKGALPEDTFKSEQVLTFNDQLVNSLIELSSTWAKHLAETDRTEAAIKLLDQVLRVNKLEESLVIMLYYLHVLNKNPIQAKDTLLKYRKALTKVEYSETEIDSYLDEVISRANTMIVDRNQITIS